MADGAVLTRGGKVIRRNGKIITVPVGEAGGCECCGGYRQARYCTTDALADVFMLIAEADEITGAFNYETDCCYFDGDNGEPGTIITPEDIEEYDGCETCCPCHDTIIVTIGGGTAYDGVYVLEKCDCTFINDPPIPRYRTEGYCDEPDADAVPVKLSWAPGALRWTLSGFFQEGLGEQSYNSDLLGDISDFRCPTDATWGLNVSVVGG